MECPLPFFYRLLGGGIWELGSFWDVSETIVGVRVGEGDYFVRDK